jgi:hypothetical protein
MRMRSNKAGSGASGQTLRLTKCRNQFLRSWKPINGGEINVEKAIRSIISIKHYSLKKKSERKDLMKHLLQWLEESPASQKQTKRRPSEERKLPIVGD